MPNPVFEAVSVSVHRFPLACRKTAVMLRFAPTVMGLRHTKYPISLRVELFRMMFLLI
jgi:hypothetical protein